MDENSEIYITIDILTGEKSKRINEHVLLVLP